MPRKYRIIIAVVLTLLTSTFYGQDVHFSQFYNSPLSLNPATTGDFVGAWRVTGIGRQQWAHKNLTTEGKPFQTMAIGFDSPIDFGHKGRLGVGGYLVQDNSGIANLNYSKFVGSIAYETNLKGGKIRFGIQPSLNQHGSDRIEHVLDGHAFSKSQLEANNGKLYDDGNPFDATRIESIDNNSQQLKYFDINAGVKWYKKINKLETTAGFSAFHLILPKYTLLEAESGGRMPIRYNFHSSLSYKYNDKLYIQPNLQFMHMARAQNIVIGANVDYQTQPLVADKKCGVLLKEIKVFKGKNAYF